MPIYWNGLILGLSLIAALGPQNIFLIRQGVMRHHALLSAATCFFCDLVLITASVVGLQDVFEAHAQLRVWMCWLGSAFLMYYGVNALKRAWVLASESTYGELPRRSRWQIIVLALGFSLLNPHAIIDSLVLIGGGSGQFPGHQRMFLFGVISSSLIWFSLLTFTAYFFAHVLARTVVWRRVELGSGILMMGLSIKLLYV